MKRASPKPHICFHTGLWWCSLLRMPSHGSWVVTAHSTPMGAYQAWKEAA